MINALHPFPGRRAATSPGPINTFWFGTSRDVGANLRTSGFMGPGLGLTANPGMGELADGEIK